MSNSKTPLLETYLAQIAHELRDLPSQARADEMREIEAHLAALVLESQQLGNLSQAQATEIALKQFGEPRKIGRKLRKAWERKQPEAWWRAASAPVFALAFSAFFVEPFEQGFTNFYSPSSMASMELVSFLLTFVTAYVMGLVSPKRAKLMISVFLVLFSTYFILEGVLFSPLGMLPEVVRFSIAAIIGSHFGSKHVRKISARIAK